MEVPFGVNVAISAKGHRAATQEFVGVCARTSLTTIHERLLPPVPYSTHYRPLR
jgi:hypothetical protein